METAHYTEALRIFSHSLKRKLWGTKKYKGNAEQICQQIIKNCWNGGFFQVSAGHFCEFYTRDFGLCIETLLALGYREECKKTLEYALSVFSKNGTVATTITPQEKPINVFSYGPDSLAFLLRSLRILNDKQLTEEYMPFLEFEAVKCFETVFDKKQGMIKRGLHVGSIKDQAVRDSSCYDNVMVASIHAELKALGFASPFDNYDFKEIIRKHFWTGSYFLDDLSGSRHIAGDANVFPFYMGIVDDRKMLNQCMETIHKEGLNHPFPLKYTMHKPDNLMIWVKYVAPNYEGTAIWMHLGFVYLQLLKAADRKRFEGHMETYRRLIEKHKNFLEVYNPDGSPYHSMFYYTDESMLWCCNYLWLKKEN